jgi:hypothetical protein
MKQVPKNEQPEISGGGYADGQCTDPPTPAYPQYPTTPDPVEDSWNDPVKQV